MVSSMRRSQDESETRAVNTTTTTVSAVLLHSFFQEAAKAMNELNYNDNDSSSVLSLLEQRRALLHVQQTCLERVVDNFDGVTVEEVQETLQLPIHDPSLEQALEEMTAAARSAFARLVVQRELTSPSEVLKKDEELLRSDIIEFCGLCKAFVRLPEIQDYLIQQDDELVLYGEQVPNHHTHGRRLFPHDRLELVQRLYLRALGYNDDFATVELKRIMSSPDHYQDTELHAIFGNAVADMRTALNNATYDVQQSQLNDFQHGGVTRVVSVSYSEQDNNTIPPRTESIHQHHREDTTSTTTTTSIDTSSKIASLEQSLLARVLQMEEEERQQMLQTAKEAQTKMTHELQQLPPGPERIQYMTTSISQETQELLLTYKLWTGLLARNGGQPPQMR